MAVSGVRCRMTFRLADGLPLLSAVSPDWIVEQINTKIREAVREKVGKEPQASAMIADSQSEKCRRR